VCGWQVKLGDRLVTHGPYMSALKIKGLYIKRYIDSFVFFLLCDYQEQYNFNKLYLVYVSCSCSCINFFTGKSADSVSLCMFLVICSNLITRKCCESNTALILLTLIFLSR